MSCMCITLGVVSLHDFRNRVSSILYSSNNHYKEWEAPIFAILADNTIFHFHPMYLQSFSTEINHAIFHFHPLYLHSFSKEINRITAKESKPRPVFVRAYRKICKSCSNSCSRKYLEQFWLSCANLCSGRRNRPQEGQRQFQNGPLTSLIRCYKPCPSFIYLVRIYMF